MSLEPTISTDSDPAAPVFATSRPSTQSRKRPDVAHDVRVTKTDARPKRGLPIWPLMILLGLVGVVGIGWWISNLVQTESSTAGLIYYRVEPQDLSITVTERGNLESQNNFKVVSQVDDIRGDGVEGIKAIYIVPNGSQVAAGDLLVEFDTSGHRDRLDQQILSTEQARTELIQAKANYTNQISQNETTEADARLQLKLSELELKMFQDEASGTHRLEVEEIKRAIDDVNNNILTAQASLKLRKNERDGIQTLFKLGYAGKSELDRAQLDFQQAEHAYAATMNQLETQLATLQKKQTYEREMQMLQLQGNMKTAEQNLRQVLVSNDARLGEAKAELDSETRSVEKEEEMLARYRDRLSKCKIYADHGGMVAYATGSGRYSRDQPIAEGAMIRERQHIMSIPDLKRMQVKTAVHESVLDQVKVDLAAQIRLDAFPDRSYTGTVKSVAVLPDSGGWMSSDTKVYPTIVVIDDEVERVNPGMTAVVEINVAELDQVLAVPVQAIMQKGKRNWCYVADGDTTRRQTLTLGRTNDKFVEVNDGLSQGDMVVLNPESVIDELPLASGNDLQNGGEPDSHEDPVKANDVKDDFAAARPQEADQQVVAPGTDYRRSATHRATHGPTASRSS